MENYSYLLGFIPLSMFLAMIGFATIGVIARLLVDAQSRDQNSVKTPVKFSFWFLLKDNWKTIILTFLAVLITLRFAGSVFPDQFSSEDLASPLGKEKWLFGSLLVGYLFNSLLQYLKEKSEVLKVKR